MTNLPINATAESIHRLFAGVDVGADELVLVIRKNGKPFDPQKYANTRCRPRTFESINCSNCRASRCAWKPPVFTISIWRLRCMTPVFP
jgi:hypothetical protein